MRSSPVQSPRLGPTTSATVGFSNIGNTCYAGAVLTLLLRCVSFADTIVATVRKHRDAMLDYTGTEGAPNARFPSTPPPSAQRSDYATPTATTKDNEGVPLHPKPIEDIMHLHCALDELIGAIKNRSTRVTPAALQKAMSGFFDLGQHDAHEFLTMLMDNLETEAKEADKQKAVLDKLRVDVGRPSGGEGLESSIGRKRNRSVLDASLLRSTKKGGEESDTPWTEELLVSTVLQTITCRNGNGCSQQAFTMEQNLMIQLPVEIEQPVVSRQSTNDSIGLLKDRTYTDVDASPPSIQDLIEHHMGDSRLEDYGCDKCKAKTNQFRCGEFIDPTPPVLLINLLRFAHSVRNGVWSMTKKKTPVKLDIFLKIVSFHVEKVEDESSDAKKDDEDESSRKKRRGEDGSDLKNDGGDDADRDAAVQPQPPQQADEAAATEKEEDPPTKVKKVRRMVTRYRLTGILRHLGSTPHAGHYITQIVDPEDVAKERVGNGSTSTRKIDGSDPNRKWCVVDDSTITPQPEQRLNLGESRDSYILRYELDQVEEDREYNEEEDPLESPKSEVWGDDLWHGIGSL